MGQGGRELCDIVRAATQEAARVPPRETESPDVDLLLVEDEPQVVKLLLPHLTRAGFSVDAAITVAAATAAVLQRRHDVVILDLKLPDGDGLDVLRAMRRHGVDTPVVILSGHGTYEAALDAGGLGAVAFLEKPVSLKTLIASVTAAVAPQSVLPPIGCLVERIKALDLDSVDAVAQCLSALFRLMSDTRIDLPAFAMLSNESQKIARMTGPLDLSSFIHTLDAMRQGPLIADPQARLALDCITSSTETDSHRLAAACGLPHKRFLVLLRTTTGQDVRYWTRIAKIRRGLPRIIAGDKLDYVAEVSGFAHADQMSRDIHAALGATATEIRASVLAASGRQIA